MIRIFKRCSWKPNKSWPHGFEPDGAATKYTVKHVETEEEARQICMDHNKDRPRNPERANYYQFSFFEFEHA